MPSILPTNYYSEKPLSIIKKLLPEGFNLIPLKNPSKQDIISKVYKADYLLAGGRIKIDNEIIEAAVKLKMIQRTGAGLDSIDLKLLGEKNIPVYVNPGVNSRSVAEHTLMLILAVLRRITLSDSILKSGTWLKHEFGIECNDLNNKTVGLIGLGHIGSNVASMLQGFGTKVIYYKRSKLTAREEREKNVSYRSFIELLKESDIISLHCPLNSETENLINRQEISLMKAGSILINTARGRLVNEHALVNGLKNGHLKGAGLDVFAKEPISEKNQLLSLKNIIISPHVAGLTFETFSNMMAEALENIRLFNEGKIEKIKEKKLSPKNKY